MVTYNGAVERQSAVDGDIIDILNLTTGYQLDRLV